MKTIIIAGAHSGVGKSCLAQSIVSLLPGAVWIKIGHHPPKPGKNENIFPPDTRFKTIADTYHAAAFLVIESNSILDTCDNPDCLIYLDGNGPKPSAKTADQRADIRSGTRVSADTINQLASCLEIKAGLMRKIAWLAGARPSPLTAIILAGGKSSRMGCDKAMLDVEGESLIQRQCDALLPYVDRIVVSSGTGKRTLPPDIVQVEDRYPGLGPLAGIHAGLAVSENDLNFVVSCDVPYIDKFALFALLSQSDDYEIVAPVFSEHGPEPLFTLYRRSLLPSIERLLGRKQLRVSSLFEHGTSRKVRIESSDWYRNLNTPQDYETYKTRAA